MRSYTLALSLSVLGAIFLAVGFVIFFGGYLPDDVLTLNIIVAQVIYWLLLGHLLRPLLGSHEATNWVARLSLNWIALSIYVLLATGCMLFANTGTMWSLKYQVMCHIALLLFFSLSMALSMRAGEQVVAVAREQNDNSRGLVALRQVLQQESHLAWAKHLEEELRYVSPSNNPEAHKVEQELLDNVHRLINQGEASSTEISHIGVLLQRRKRIYSN